jgi:hypothetical protein
MRYFNSRLPHYRAADGRDGAKGEIAYVSETVMARMELPHWLILAGALLVMGGFLGLAFTRNREVEDNPGAPSHEPASRPRQQMPPLPSLLDSDPKKKE